MRKEDRFGETKRFEGVVTLCSIANADFFRDVVRAAAALLSPLAISRSHLQASGLRLDFNSAHRVM
jgi:hypothetical protein